MGGKVDANMQSRSVKNLTARRCWAHQKKKPAIRRAFDLSNDTPATRAICVVQPVSATHPRHLRGARSDSPRLS
jgi:hypothetical protein